MLRRGFTLVELILVILILGILATFSGRFMGLSMRLYQDSQMSSQRLAEASFMLERLKLEIRGSYRTAAYTFGSDHCLGIVPVLGAGAYLGSATGASLLELVQSDNFQSNDFQYQHKNDNDFVDRRIGINAAHQAEIYQDQASLVAASGAVGIVQSYQLLNSAGKEHLAEMELAGSRSFSVESGAQRYSIFAAHPVAFCFIGDELRRYQLNSWSKQIGVPTGGALLGKSLQASTLGQFKINQQRDVLIELRLNTPGANPLIFNQLVFMNYGP